MAMVAAMACSPTSPAIRTGGADIIAVRVPRSADGDAPALLVDHASGAGAWYCTASTAPLRFELMFADGLPRRVRGVGVIASNLGPDGLGPIEVRVQSGHGIAAQGEVFHARAPARNGELVVLDLPAPARGDHVVLTLLRRSSYSTARCLGELLLFDSAHRAPDDARHIPLLVETPEADASTPPADAANADATSSPADGAVSGDAGDAATDASLTPG